MLLELLKKLPSKRKELVPKARPLAMTPLELEELRRHLKDLLDVGRSFGASILLQKKHDASLWMCINYQTLNKLNKYPELLIANLFDQVGVKVVY